MNSVNPPDAPGYTQMYSFGVKMMFAGHRDEYLVMTVRALSEDAARGHIWSIFAGGYKSAVIQYFSDMDEWKREAETERKPYAMVTDTSHAQSTYSVSSGYTNIVPPEELATRRAFWKLWNEGR